MTSKAVELVGSIKLLMREIEPPAQISALVTITFDRFEVTAKAEERIMFTLPNNKQARVRIAYVDQDGNPAVVDGDVRWSSSDEAIARVTADDESEFACEALVQPGGTIGQAQITAKADADLGEGVRELITLMDIIVVGGEAVAGTIEPVGELEDAPAIDNTLPGSQPRPDNTLPGGQPGIDNTLPGGQPARPDNALPETGDPKRHR